MEFKFKTKLKNIVILTREISQLYNAENQTYQNIKNHGWEERHYNNLSVMKIKVKII